MQFLVTFSEDGDSQPFTTPTGEVYIRRVPGAYFLIDDTGTPLTGGMTLEGCVSVLRRKMFPGEPGLWTPEDDKTNGGAF
jgi:hypothetical protein